MLAFWFSRVQEKRDDGGSCSSWEARSEARGDSSLTPQNDALLEEKTRSRHRYSGLISAYTPLPHLHRGPTQQSATIQIVSRNLYQNRKVF